MSAYCWPIVYNVDPTPNQHLWVNEKKYPKVLITAMTITWALTVNMIKLATSSVVFMQTVNMNVIFTLEVVGRGSETQLKVGEKVFFNIG